MDSTIDVCVNFIISLRNYKNYSIYKTERKKYFIL